MASKTEPSLEKEPVTSFEVRVADDLSQFGDLWPQTDRILGKYCYAFQCADILKIWCDTIGKSRCTRTLFVAVFDGSGRPVLLLPLGIEHHRGLRILRFLDGGVCDYNGPVIVEPQRTWSKEVLDLMWKKVTQALPRFDLIIFEKMPDQVCGAENPLKLFGKPDAPSGHFLDITDTWESYKASKLPFKRETSYQRRRLARRGSVKIFFAESSADRTRILDAMLRQKSQRYLETRGEDGLKRAGHQQYYTAIANHLKWPGPLLMCALEVDGQVIATNWGFVSGKRFLGIVMSFEGGEWRGFSPGRILLEELIQWCFDNQIAVFDFGIGDESYKVSYTNRDLSLYHATLPVTTAGTLYLKITKSHVWKKIRPFRRLLIR